MIYQNPKCAGKYHNEECSYGEVRLIFLVDHSHTGSKFCNVHYNEVIQYRIEHNKNSDRKLAVYSWES